MIEYVSQSDTCRSAYLLEYFGQKESADCGTCDVCRAKASSGASTNKRPDLEAEMTAFINDEVSGSYTLEDILGRFTAPGRYSTDECITVLRRLIDQSQVPPHKAE